MKCGFDKKKCIEDDCMFWVHIRGKHPQSHADLDMYDCTMKWLPVLLIENSQQTRQTAAATESFRNEMVRLGTVKASIPDGLLPQQTFPR